MQVSSQRRGAVLLLAAVIAVGASLLVAAPAAHAAGGSGGCNVINPLCTVTTGVGGSDRADRSGAAAVVDAGCRNTDPLGGGCDPCPPDAAYGAQPPAVSQLCSDYLRNGYCDAVLGDMLAGLNYQSINNLKPAQASLVNSNLADAGCPAVVTPASLAHRAYASIRFPRPSGHRSPPAGLDYKGYPVTYVGLWTYFWTDPATWKPLTATARAGGLAATVTARPVALVFDPGDGASPVSCAGPGQPWTDSDGNSAPSGGACGYRYTRVTGPGYDHPITSTQTIVWKITWSGTGDTSGEIPQLSTSTSGRLNVLQIQTVNR